jgi:hypothetical protein
MGAGVVQWQLSDPSADWAARFYAGVDSTGQLPPTLQQILAYRLLCVFLINQIRDDLLPEVVETLLDIHKYKNAPPPEYEEPKLRHVHTSVPRQIGRLW